jgi:hypothetical protein
MLKKKTGFYIKVAKNIENIHNSFNDKYELTWLIGPIVLGEILPKRLWLISSLLVLREPPVLVLSLK